MSRSPWWPCGLGTVDLVNHAVRERDHKQGAGGPGLDVRGNAKVLAEQQAFALSQVVFIEVIRHPIVQPWIAEDERVTIVIQLEAPL